MPIEQGGSPANPDPSTETKQDDIISYLNTIGVREFFNGITAGNKTNFERWGFGSHNPGAALGTEENIWTQGGLITYLTAETTLYASSSSAGDSQTLVVTGLDGDYARVTRLVTLNGQNQVALNAGLLSIESVVALVTNPVGDVYIAESDTLTDGVPDTASKIKAKMLAGYGQYLATSYTVPAGKQAFFYQLSYNIGPSKSADVFFRTKPFGFTAFKKNFPIYIYEQSDTFFEKVGFLLPEKLTLDFTLIPNDADTAMSLSYTIIEETL